jgi:zinc transport system substrate-binding protein
MTLKKIAVLAVLCITVSAGIFFAVRQSPSISSDSKLTVVASDYPLFDFAQHVGGKDVSVVNVTPPGAEPHEYVPSPKTLVTAQKADVFIFNGEWLEPWTAKFIKDYDGTLIRGGDGISILKNNNPHFWLDPVLAQKMVDTIRDGLIKADPAGKAYYTKNAAAYNTMLDQLDKDFRDGLRNCQQHTIIAAHDALGYLADRYDFEAVPIAGINPEEEPSPARLAELSNIVKQKGIKYIFFETLVSPRLADTIAQESGVKTLVFDPIEGLNDESQKQGKDYISIQRENLVNLRTALACQ